MTTNKNLWRKARLSLCKSIGRLINKHSECLISLRVSYADGVKMINVSPDQARRILAMISKETEAIK